MGKLCFPCIDGAPRPDMPETLCELYLLVLGTGAN
jgi:hypothetical protein